MGWKSAGTCHKSGHWKAGLLALCVGVLLGVLALPCRAETRAVRTRVAPVYPEIAKRLHVTGIVKLEVTVDADGKVTAVKTVSGNHTLAVAAEEAVQKWRFASGTGDATFDVDINFEMNQ